MEMQVVRSGAAGFSTGDDGAVCRSSSTTSSSFLLWPLGGEF